MDLTFDQIKTTQTAAPPKYDQQGMLISSAPSTGFVGLQASQIPGSPTYIPPNPTAPVPSANLGASPLNFASGGTPDNGSSAVAGVVGGMTSDPLSGDYSQDKGYQTANTQLNDSIKQLMDLQNSQKDSYDMYKQAQAETGATANLAEVAKLKNELAASVASFNNEIAQTETKGIQSGTPALFYQGEQAAKQRQASILTTGIASRLSAAQQNWEMAENLAQKTVDLKFADQQQKINNKLQFIQLNQDNLNRSEKLAVSKMESSARQEQEKLNEQKAKMKDNLALSFSLGITTRFMNKNGEFSDTRTGETYATEQDFYKAAGVRSFDEAYSRGLISNIDNSTIIEKQQVGKLMSDYWDAGITMSDTMQSAQAKLKNSNIYQKQNSVSRSGGGSGGGGGVVGGIAGSYGSDLDAMVGTVLSTIPSKFGQETFRTEISKARDDADKINILAAQVLKGQPAEFKNDFRNQAVGIAQIDKAIAELDAGVQTGVINSGIQYAYNVVGKDFDPKLAKINGYITSAIQPYRNSVTGAAWGEQEDGEYAQLFGSTKYSPQELKQRLTQVKELLKSKSSAGLNAFVNPVGSYDNVFDTGNLSPATTSNTTPNEILTTPETQNWWSKTTNFLFGDD